jgi:hypothetical protein
MQNNDANVVVLTYYHSITGRLLLRGQRLSDFLNDRRETVIRLHDSVVSRLNNPAKIVSRDDTAVLHKDHVVIVFETAQPTVPAEKRAFAFTLKQAHEVFLIMESIEVRGFMYTKGNFDVLEIHRFIATSGESFVPITDATVTLPDLNFSKQTGVMVNVHHIHYIAKAKETKA